VSKLSFRLLILLSVVSSILSVVIPEVWPSEKTQLLELQLVEEDMNETMLWVSLAAIVFYSVLYIVETIALLLFVSWAKPLYVVMIFLSIPLYFLLDISIVTPLVQFLYDMGMFCSGMILVLLYTDPFDQYFKKSG